ncbi:MAG: hypothetical protein J6S00_05025, partial [Clostridia bacterium]|nr:hypothetical protein [Clostridia bacterium]
VTVSDAEVDTPIGIFGMFNSLTVEFNTAIPENAPVLAQDLLDSKAVDITNMVSVNKNTLTVDGKILRMVGKLSRPVRDKSDPSLVLKIVNG